MAIGYFIGLGDKTSCGGKVLDADTYQIVGGIPNTGDGALVAEGVMCGLAVVGAGSYAAGKAGEFGGETGAELIYKATR